LFFICAGPETPYSREFWKTVPDYVRKNIIIKDFISNEEKNSILSETDIFVMPSGYGETAPLTVNEAMCFGLPIIVSDVIGTSRDRVHHGENGFIFPLGDKGRLTG